MSLHNRDAEGEKRFDEQYWRANVDPSERYVLSVVGSTHDRLTAGESGFENLYLAGDWIKTGLNCGCMEATVMSEMQASRAISSYPEKGPGKNDFWSDGVAGEPSTARQFRRRLSLWKWLPSAFKRTATEFEAYHSRRTDMRNARAPG